jgi:CheY-like chemotaxis protein
MGYSDQCLQAGMNSYVSKPVRKEELVEILKEISPPSKPVAC